MDHRRHLDKIKNLYARTCACTSAAIRKEKEQELWNSTAYGIHRALVAGRRLAAPQIVPYTYEGTRVELKITDVGWDRGAAFFCGTVNDYSRELALYDVRSGELDTRCLVCIYAALVDPQVDPTGIQTFADLVAFHTGAKDAFYLRHVAGAPGFEGTIGPLSTMNAPLLPKDQGGRVLFRQFERMGANRLDIFVRRSSPSNVPCPSGPCIDRLTRREGQLRPEGAGECPGE